MYLKLLLKEFWRNIVNILLRFLHSLQLRLHYFVLVELTSLSLYFQSLDNYLSMFNFEDKIDELKKNIAGVV